MKINIKELRKMVKNSLHKLTEMNHLNQLSSVEEEIQLPNGDIIDMQFFGDVKTERNSVEDEGLPESSSFIDGGILWNTELYTREENEGIKQALANPKISNRIENALINSTLDSTSDDYRDFDYGEYQLNHLD